jgi:hypothetical protein
MKRILLLLITYSSISLLAMDDKKQIIPITTPTHPPVHTAQMHRAEVLGARMMSDEEPEERCRAIAQCTQYPLKALATVACVIACPLAIVGDTITCCSCPRVCNTFETTRPCYNAIVKTNRCTPLSCYPGCDPCCDPCCPHPDPKTMNIFDRPWSRHYIPCTATVYHNWGRFICNNE